MWGDTSLWFSVTFLWWSVVLSTFSYSFGHLRVHVFFRQMFNIKVFSPFFNQVIFIFLAVWAVRVSYIFWKLTPYQTWFANSSSPSTGCLSLCWLKGPISLFYMWTSSSLSPFVQEAIHSPFCILSTLFELQLIIHAWILGCLFCSMHLYVCLFSSTIMFSLL